MQAGQSKTLPGWNTEMRAGPSRYLSPSYDSTDQEYSKVLFLPVGVSEHGYHNKHLPATSKGRLHTVSCLDPRGIKELNVYLDLGCWAEKKRLLGYNSNFDLNLKGQE